MQIEDWPEGMKVYVRRLKELFGMPTPSIGQSGNTLTARFSKGNYSFKDSKYFLHPAKQPFSHLTTNKGLFGIINSGVIRLYNLTNSNDPNELFTIRGIPSYEQAPERLKPHVYTFSFYKSERISNPIMWINYGQVALNFEIVNDPLTWKYYRISAMHYGESDFVPKYMELLNEMHVNYHPWQFTPDLESMLSLLAFHKEEAHKHEQEVRLLYVPFLFQDRDEANFDFHLSKIRTGLTKYVELPLWVEENEKARHFKVPRHPKKVDESLPLIKITSIEFGDNEPSFDQIKLDNLRYELEDYLIAKFGYGIEVKQNLFETGYQK